MIIPDDDPDMVRWGPDVVRWGLHDLIDVGPYSNRGSVDSVTCHSHVSSQEQYVKQGYCQSASVNVESDRMIALALQEELTRLADAEAAGLLHAREKLQQQEAILCQDWGNHSKRNYDSVSRRIQEDKDDDEPIRLCPDSEENARNSVSQSNQEDADGGRSFRLCPDPKENAGNSVSQRNQEDADGGGSFRLCPDPKENACNSVSQSNQEDADAAGSFRTCPDPEETDVQTEQCAPVVENECTLDGEVGKRLNHMVPVAHVPKTNGEMPTVDEATSDHQRLLERLALYDLVELKVSGDGNCQFRSLSDQIYRNIEHHEIVRQRVVDQLRSYPDWYKSYVPMGYDEYIKRMSKNGEWGDHVTLQAAADSYGLRMFVITSFKDTCYIEILPREQKSKRLITLSFWAEVHYNSIYPNGELPAPVTKRKKKTLWRWLDI